MTESKGWEWNKITEDENELWRNPVLESYGLMHRWAGKGMWDFLDLGCGLGRHSMLFGRNGFNVSCMDISADA